jgi:hypothetical protein
VTKDFAQMPEKQRRPFRLTHLKTLNQVVVALGKTLRAAANNEIEPQLARTLIAGLTALRECIESNKTQKTVDELAQKVALLASMAQMKDITGYGGTQPIIDTKAIRPN